MQLAFERIQPIFPEGFRLPNPGLNLIETGAIERMNPSLPVGADRNEPRAA